MSAPVMQNPVEIFLVAVREFNPNPISLIKVKNAILYALGIDATGLNIMDPTVTNINIGAISSAGQRGSLNPGNQSGEYDNMFYHDNPRHVQIINQVVYLLDQDTALNGAITQMLAPNNPNLQQSTRDLLTTLKENLAVLQGLVLREKLKRTPNFDPLLAALNDKVKTLSSILAVQTTGNVNFQLGGSIAKLKDISNYIKYKMKYLIIKYRK